MADRTTDARLGKSRNSALFTALRQLSKPEPRKVEVPAPWPASNTVTAASRAAIAYTRNPAQRNIRCFPRDILTLIPPPRDGHEDMQPLSHWPCGDALDITTQYGCMYDARGILLVDFSFSFFAVRREGPSQLDPARHSQFRK
jgi:hypothetical protein